MESSDLARHYTRLRLMPVIGVGTSEVFDLGPGDRVGPTAVVRLVAGGGSSLEQSEVR